ncbi:TIM-barrel domain-containing protein [Hymenobacter persicinus]|uniref:DUF5110 domain-containing protein n=1 Tax=Hymenobacter persicinus TaxID=2025506 RepID=A0A4V1ZAP8_9BACT|nr:TIM-barrel domain-containing protein [Hymenobacter persicinus]RYU79148.1 DUF5110 domain-containing protein [Hymenobacter persicinus]
MPARFRRALLLSLLFSPLVPAAYAQREAGPPTQDPFAKREVPATPVSIGNYRSHTYDDGILSIQSTDGGTLRIRPWAEGVIRVEFFPLGSAVKPDASVSVVQVPRPPQPNRKLETYLNNRQPDGSLVRSTANELVWPQLAGSTVTGTVVIQKNPLRVSYRQQGETLVSEAAGVFQRRTSEASGPGGTGVSFRLSPGEHLYGTGSRALPLDRRGRRLELYNQAHYGFQNGAANLGITLPVVVSSRGYALLFDHYTAATLDLGATRKDVLEYSGENLVNLGYFIIAGSSYAEILDRYTQLTGRQPLPPRWALGLLQSRFGYRSQLETEQVARRMRRADFPLDALVLDLYWFGTTKDQGNLEWDYNAFPKPATMLRRLDSAGVKTVLISEPYVMRTSRNDAEVRARELVGTDERGRAYTVASFWAGPATLLDMFRPETQDWLWTYYKRRKEEGVAGWWSDLGEPENHPLDMHHLKGSTRALHNAYGLAWSDIFAKKYAEQYRDERLFNLVRSGWAGMQRNSVFPWSGDVSRSWSGYQAQIPIILGMGMGGVGYMHSDAGGFAGSNTDAELYTRWMQLASLGPVLRPHAVVAPEPYWYPEPYRSSVRNATHLRYELLPYLYTLAWENSQTGTPLVRPMNYGPTHFASRPGGAADSSGEVGSLSAEEKAAGFTDNSTWAGARAEAFTVNRRWQEGQQQNEALANVNDQYLLGPNLLVAPVMHPGQRRRNVVLPAGRWIDFYSNQTLTGGRTVAVPAPLARIPLLVRAGAFLPLAPYVNTTAHYRTDTLRVRYYADPAVPASSFTLYDDDGKSALVGQTQMFQLISFTGQTSAAQTDITVSVAGKSYATAPGWRTIELLVPRVAAAPAAVLLDGETVPPTEWHYDPATGQLRLQFLLESKSVQVSIRGLKLTTTATQGSAPEPATLEAPDSRTFVGSTTLRYSLLTPGAYPLRIRNAAGTLVRTLTPGFRPVGAHTLLWDGRNEAGQPVAGGVYSAELNGQHQQLVMLPSGR